jgi:hypothetical protein
MADVIFAYEKFINQNSKTWPTHFLGNINTIFGCQNTTPQNVSTLLKTWWSII